MSNTNSFHYKGKGGIKDEWRLRGRGAQSEIKFGFLSVRQDAFPNLILDDSKKAGHAQRLIEKVL